MHVGLYTDSSGTPNSLVSGSDSLITISNATGWITYPVTSFNLPAGTYWIVFTFDAANPSGWVLRPAPVPKYIKHPGHMCIARTFPSGSSSGTNGLFRCTSQVLNFKATPATSNLSSNNANFTSVSFYSTRGKCSLAI